MNRTLSLKNLWWKEFVQLLPLIGVVLCLGGLQVLLGVLPLADRDTADAAWRHIFLGLALPGLFAVGAGALVVGQEKEQRTLNWLRSLPIAAKDIVMTKLVSSLIALIVVWLVSLLVTRLMLWQHRSASVVSEIELLPFVFHTFFLLAVGFTTAWLFRSSFVSLLVVVPVAALPFVAAAAYEWLAVNAFQMRPYESSLPYLAYSFIFGLVFYVWAWRQGIKSLGAERVRDSRTASNTASGLTSSYFGATPLFAVSNIYPALVWQFARQNTLAIIGLAVLLISSTVFIVSMFGENSGVVASVVCILSASWLGQLVFQGDSVDRRHLFLATRGISPWRVWATRQLIPLAILAVCVTIILLRVESLFSLMLVSPLLAVYAASQFLCQSLKSPILGAIASPVFAATMAVYFYYVNSLVPIWLVLICIFFFLIATLIMTRSWMDGRTGWSNLFKYLGLLLIAVVVPWVPTFYCMATLPQLSSSEFQQLQRLAIAADEQLLDNSELPLASDSTVVEYSDEQAESSDAGDESSVEATSEQRHYQLLSNDFQLLQSTLEQLQVSTTGTPNNVVLRSLVPKMLLSRLALEQSGAPENLERYRLTVELAYESAARLRRSRELEMQNEADVLEIGLLEEMRQPRAQELMGVELSSKVIAMLKNNSERDQARRMAIAEQWERARSSTIWSGFALNRILDLSYFKMLKFTEASAAERSNVSDELRRYSSRIFVPETRWQPKKLYEVGDDGKPQLLYSELDSYGRLGGDWYGQWETLASEL